MSATDVTTDWHIGVSRVGGTTPETQVRIRQKILREFAAQLGDNDHLIAGDLFDSFTVDTSEIMKVYQILATWLSISGKQICLLRGNHDYHPSGGKESSFNLLGEILCTHFPEQVTVATEVTRWKNFVLVPHVPNNEILKLEIDKIWDEDGKFIVFHANVANKFAQDSLHSLNVTQDVLDHLSKKNTLVFGHEHQHRVLNDGKVIVLGNATPSSVADCLGAQKKCLMRVDGNNYKLETIWERDVEFCETDWTDISDQGKPFVRVTGKASSSQSSEVIEAIAKFRKSSKALVITNAVEVEGVGNFEEIEAIAVDDVKSYDVLSSIYAELDEREVSVIKNLLQENLQC